VSDEGHEKLNLLSYLALRDIVVVSGCVIVCMTKTTDSSQLSGASGSHSVESPNRLEYSIKQAANLVGMTERALRYYQQLGLIPVSVRKGGSLIYTKEHLLPLLQIRRLTALGLTLDDVAELLSAPDDAHTVRQLENLDRALADRVTEIQAQRRVIGELLRTQLPVDTLPEFARYITALQRLGAQNIDIATIALINTVAGFASEDDAEALNGLIDQLPTFPSASGLIALEERLHAIEPDATERDIATLALDYGQVLTEIYDDFIAHHRNGLLWSADSAVTDISAAIVGYPANDRQRDVLSRAITVLMNHASHIDG